MQHDHVPKKLNFDVSGTGLRSKIAFDMFLIDFNSVCMRISVKNDDN